MVPKPAEQHWRLRVAAGQETLCVLAGAGLGPGASPESEKFSYSKVSLATGGLEDCESLAEFNVVFTVGIISVWPEMSWACA